MPKGETPPPAPDSPGFRLPDAAEIGRSMADIAERSQRIVTEWLKRQADSEHDVDPLNVGSAFLEMTARLMANPARLVQAQIGFWQDYMTLWQNTARRMMGLESEPVIDAPTSDRRFKDDAWREHEVFDFIKQSYLLSARYVQDVVKHVDGLEPKTAQKVDFYARQFIDAMSPSNFLLTNPEVLRKTAETGGENLLKGLSNLLSDLERGKGRLHIKMTDLDAFQVGENIGVSPGKVVYQNDLMQLIQYAPTTEKVLKRPLLIGPPWINKFYILDLRPRNSFVRWAVSQGHTVFVISWVNPSSKLAEKGFEDYMSEGYLAALDAIEAATGEREINAIGYCLGGTLLGATLAYMAANGDDRIKSATFFVSMLDFAESGELGVFIDEEQLRTLEGKMSRRGYLEGTEMATTFNLLRANDLIWSFVVNNYLMGNEPFPFDLLYWNSDSTRMPAKMHSFYLRKMYQENLLATQGGISLNGVPIDLGKIKIPAYFLSTREDHIAPWKSTYRGTQLLGGKKRFVLAASGHIAGVVNPPEGGKYSHWVNTSLRDRDRRVLVGRLAALGDGAGERAGASARAGRRQAGGDRGRARQLREGEGGLIPLGYQPACSPSSSAERPALSGPARSVGRG
jgi:polyhydroxyalkanoate synthase